MHAILLLGEGIRIVFKSILCVTQKSRKYILLHNVTQTKQTQRSFTEKHHLRRCRYDIRRQKSVDEE